MKKIWYVKQRIILWFLVSLVIVLFNSNLLLAKAVNCERFFENYIPPSLSINKKHGSVVPSSPKNPSEPILNILAGDIRSSQIDRSKVMSVLSDRASLRRKNEILERLKVEALNSIEVDRIRKSGVNENKEHLHTILFSMVKKITNIKKQQRYTAHIIQLIQNKTEELVKNNGNSKIILKDWKNTYFLSSDPQYVIEQDIVIPLREYIYTLLVRDNQIVEAYGSENILEKAVIEHVSLGLNRTFVGTAIASKISVLEKGKIIKFTQKRLLTILNKAMSTLDEIPAIYKRNGLLKQEVISAFRASKDVNYEEIRNNMPESIRTHFNHNSMDLIKAHLDYVNVLDYIPPASLPVETAREILHNIDNGNLKDALRLRLEYPTNVQRQLQGNLKGKRLLMVFDHKNLGLQNYYLIMSKIPGLINHLKKAENPNSENPSALVRETVRQILDLSDQIIKENAKKIRSILAKNGFNGDVYVEGDEIYALSTRFSGSGKVFEQILSSTKGLRAAGVIIDKTNKLENILLKVDELLDLIKKIEKNGVEGSYVLGVGDNNMIVSKTIDDKLKVDNLFNIVDSQNR